MSPRPRATFGKRQRENAKKEKKAEKHERRARRKAERPNSDSSLEGEEDPDIAGIVPGPQPIPDEEEEL